MTGGYLRLPRSLLQHVQAGKLSLIDVVVAAAIVDKVRAKWGGRCFPSQETVASELGVSSRTVRRSVSNLLAQGVITKRRRGRSNSDEYRLAATDDRPDCPVIDEEAARDDRTGCPINGGMSGQVGRSSVDDRTDCPPIKTEPEGKTEPRIRKTDEPPERGSGQETTMDDGDVRTALAIPGRCRPRVGAYSADERLELAVVLVKDDVLAIEALDAKNRRRKTSHGTPDSWTAPTLLAWWYLLCRLRWPDEKDDQRPRALGQLKNLLARDVDPAAPGQLKLMIDNVVVNWAAVRERYRMKWSHPRVGILPIKFDDLQADIRRGGTTTASERVSRTEVEWDGWGSDA